MANNPYDKKIGAAVEATMTKYQLRFGIPSHLNYFAKNFLHQIFVDEALTDTTRFSEALEILSEISLVSLIGTFLEIHCGNSSTKLFKGISQNLLRSSSYN